MKYTTSVILFTAMACSAAMAASTESVSSSVIRCKSWEADCRIGTDYDKSEKDTSCKPRIDSTMACVDLCCKQLVAPTPSAKPSSFIKCKEWNGECRVGSEYDKNEKTTRCKNRTDSTEACVDLCCKPLVAPTPSAKPSSFVKCKEWNGECRVGSEYDTNEKNTRCKDRTDSTEACVDLCCSQFVAPAPSAIPSIIICKDWKGKCRVGTDYDQKQKNTRCKDRSDSTMACVDECCTHQ
ncbi:hypothetical protein SARC_12647 [Sphaeroforma arctica JP610]|uniref:Uncharacterized protein n=1 Tax=Sphaeroforma arctica JP610 TaxID=667725 RepID=A0A0L0FDG6_9EUKA|nr:hypothetical protein SARC_12647 [Sphaeroforma arctica JP610]KNC74814.1 hypothetical protein SARC_12647 [Sphaeroforma arctica JP610]|eukprot:XP_014148716.1 hypothetical protein SARC_12647 [Sphaeroforma arctica JP610]